MISNCIGFDDYPSPHALYSDKAQANFHCICSGNNIWTLVWYQRSREVYICLGNITANHIIYSGFRNVLIKGIFLHIEHISFRKFMWTDEMNMVVLWIYHLHGTDRPHGILCCTAVLFYQGSYRWLLIIKRDHPDYELGHNIFVINIYKVHSNKLCTSSHIKGVPTVLLVLTYLIYTKQQTLTFLSVEEGEV